MDLKTAKKLTLFKNGHLTSLGISCLIDDEMPGGLDTVMRHHIKGCAPCRSRMAGYLRVDNVMRPDK